MGATAKRPLTGARMSTEALAQECLRLLMGGALDPEARVTERWVVDQFGVTHAQAREALHRLEKRGALILTPRRGATLLGVRDADRDEVRPVWLALLKLAVQLAGERGGAAAARSGSLSGKWNRHLAVEAAIDSIASAAGNARLGTALHRLAVEVGVAHRGETPLDAEAMIELTSALAANRLTGADRLVRKTYAGGRRRNEPRNAALALLSRAPLAPAFEVGKYAPRVRAYLRRVAEHVGVATENAPPAATQLAEVIRQRIQFGELRPGDAVREQPLAQAYGVSRGPVRDALRILDREGLVTLHGRRGAAVRGLSAKDGLDMSKIRAAVSGVQMAEAARMEVRYPWVDAELQSGVDLLEKIAADRGSPLSNYIVARRVLAVVTLAAGGNVVVGRLSSALESEVTTLWATVLSKDRQKTSAKTWRRIVDAILAHDAEEAETLGRRIVEDAFSAALDTVEMQALKDD